MAHEVESAVYAGNRPAWHGLGVVLPSESIDSQEALQYSGLSDWQLTKQAIYIGNPEDGYKVIPEKFAVVRGKDNSPLGVVGDLYTIVPNEEAFDWMDTLLGGEGFHYEAAGSLRGGKIVWLLAKAPFAIDLPDSPIDTYVLLTNSHDGSSTVKALITPTRVVCMNTLRAALKDNQASYAIRHTTNAVSKLSEAQKVLGLAKGAAERMKVEAERMIADKITDKQFLAFLEKLTPVPAEEGRARTNAQKVQTAIKTIYHEAPDQKMIEGTAWGVYNAVVAYNDHGRKEADADENRMIRVMLKDSARRMPQKALALLNR